jgi:di/tricarboxylate transporter
MGGSAWFTVGLTVSLVGLMAFTRLAPDVVLVGGVTLLMLLGILDPDQALRGLSNEGMVSVGTLYVVVTGLRDTGAVAWLVQRFFGRPKTLVGAQTRLMAPVIVMSAFLNNTPVVAMLIPAVSDWAKRFRLPASKLMIPLSYAAILGGTCTLIGTSTNLVVHGLMLDNKLPGLSMFEIAWVGIPCALVGLAYVLVFGRWLLPDRASSVSRFSDPRQYTVEMLVPAGSPLADKSIEQAGLRHLPGTFLIEIDRDGTILAAVEPTETLRQGDRLIFAGVVESVVDLQKIRGLEPATDQVFKLDSPRRDRCLIEAVVSTSCPVVGRTIREGRFRNAYNAVVIAVARDGERIRRKIGDIALRPGDTLLLEAHPAFVEQQRNARDFLLVSPLEGSNPPRHERAPIALAILAGMVLLVTLEVTSLLKAAFLAAGLMLLTRCCSSREARRGVDWQVLIVIAASFALGTALETTGAAKAIASGVISLAAGHPWAALAVVYGVTMLFTELITNNAAAVLIFPIALATSRELGVSFQPFAVAIMMAASASFSTPIGYQTNLMVYGPGGYRFTDYFRVGIPLNLMLWAICSALIPWIWPFLPTTGGGP